MNEKNSRIRVDRGKLVIALIICVVGLLSACKTTKPQEVGTDSLTTVSQDAGAANSTVSLQETEKDAPATNQDADAIAPAASQDADTVAPAASQDVDTVASAGTSEAMDNTASTPKDTSADAPESVLHDAGTDYSAVENWAYYGIGDDKNADLFLICPTVDTKDEYNMSLDDERTKANFIGALNMERGIYEDSTRMYAPFYRQAAMKVYGLEEAEWEPYMDIAYRDVSDAFGWYLEHENDGRPIILAGFSQGADMCYRLLKEYFADEKLYEQLVAVYAIGWRCTKELTEEIPQIKPAQGAADVGVVVSFDCESPSVEETFITPIGIGALTINPLNWRTDGEMAEASKNLGACFTDYDGTITKEVPGLCGCYIDEARGVLKVTDVEESDYPPIVPGLPDGAYHIYDYQFFFRNLQENVKTRLDAYLGATNHQFN